MAGGFKCFVDQGIYAFISLPKLEDPFITIREAVVVAKYPGMPVEQVERLNLMEGIMKVDMTGVQDERIYIEVSNAKITQVEIKSADIGKSLREQNILLPGGKMGVNNVEFVIETLGRFKSIGQP